MSDNMKRDYVYISCILFCIAVIAAGVIHKQHVDSQVAMMCVQLQSTSSVCEDSHE